MLSVVTDLVGSDTSVRSEAPKLATSVGPFGTVSGNQLLGSVQSLLTGSALQVALPAMAPLAFRQRIRGNKRACVMMVLNTWSTGLEIMPAFLPIPFSFWQGKSGWSERVATVAPPLLANRQFPATTAT
jgi:xanthosine utilization system XapX-like protein